MILFILAYISDLVFGDPEWFPHPVKWMGKFITFLDNRLGNSGSVSAERIKGAIMAITVICISALCAYISLKAAAWINPILGYAIWVYVAYTTIAVRDLHDKAKAVLNELSKGSIAGARKELSKIVSRNTAGLDKDKIIISTVESVAENTADGIVAPIFYLILGGPILAIAYKSVSTLDSMVGYKNERYKNFGWFSARLDDAANYIPARLCGTLISVASFILGMSFTNSFKAMLRDGRKHPSPNSGISEAAMAGALGIQLGGIWSYNGKVASKPFLGDPIRPVQAYNIGDAIKISFVTSLLMVLMGVICKWLV